MKKVKFMIIGLIVLFSSGNLISQNANEIALKVYNRTTAKDGESDMTMKLINSKNKVQT